MVRVFNLLLGAGLTVALVAAVYQHWRETRCVRDRAAFLNTVAWSADRDGNTEEADLARANAEKIRAMHWGRGNACDWMPRGAELQGRR